LKVRIVAEASRGDTSVAEIARRHGMNANLVFAWKKALSSRSVATSNEFIPIEIAPPACPPPVISAASERTAGAEQSAVIEIVLRDGTRLRCDAAIGDRALRRVLTILKALM
jgi:transposase